MKGFIIILTLSLLLSCIFAYEPIKMLLEQKARLTKTSVDGMLITPQLKAHGVGLTDGQ